MDYRPAPKEFGRSLSTALHSAANPAPQAQAGFDAPAQGPTTPIELQAMDDMECWPLIRIGDSFKVRIFAVTVPSPPPSRCA